MGLKEEPKYNIRGEISMKKKLLSLILIVAMSLVSIPALAAKNTVSELNNPTAIVTSPEFPNAYIITEVSKTKGTEATTNENNEEFVEVKATVFVEETYEMIEDKIVVTNSRLLSKKEVDAIGVKNFKPLKNNKVPEVSTQSAINERGTLTIIFDASGNKTSSSSKYYLNGKAEWSGFDFFYSSKNNPAIGEDFFGFAWGGDFESSNISASATWHSTGASGDIYLSEAAPNAGVVWEFLEYVNPGGKYPMYVDKVNIKATLSKNNLTGGGNTTQAILKYIHTYQSTTGSVSISAGPGGVGAGFTLSNTDKQWHIVTIMNGLYY